MHLGGELGTRLLAHLLDKGWLVRGLGSRELILTARGQRLLQQQFGVVPL